MEKKNRFFVGAGCLPRQEVSKCQYCDEPLRLKKGGAWVTEGGLECLNQKCPTKLTMKGEERRVGW